jgi:hypothetical protein
MNSGPWRSVWCESAVGLQFLCNGIEDDMIMRLKAVNGKAPSRPEALEAASGKLLLVRKLLTKLRSEKRRVLIFSQFKIMLDLLEEMLEEHLQLPYERLDGDTKGAVLRFLLQMTTCLRVSVLARVSVPGDQQFAPFSLLIW